MKKILIILLMLIFTLTWCSCGMNEKKTEVYKYSDKILQKKFPKW